MAKVNVATDCVRAWWDTLDAQKQAGRNLWLPIALHEAMQNVADCHRTLAHDVRRRRPGPQVAAGLPWLTT